MSLNPDSGVTDRGWRSRNSRCGRKKLSPATVKANPAKRAQSRTTILFAPAVAKCFLPTRKSLWRSQFLAFPVQHPRERQREGRKEDPEPRRLDQRGVDREQADEQHAEERTRHDHVQREGTTAGHTADHSAHADNSLSRGRLTPVRPPRPPRRRPRADPRQTAVRPESASGTADDLCHPDDGHSHSGGQTFIYVDR